MFLSTVTGFYNSYSFTEVETNEKQNLDNFSIEKVNEMANVTLVNYEDMVKWKENMFWLDVDK